MKSEGGDEAIKKENSCLPPISKTNRSNNSTNSRKLVAKNSKNDLNSVFDDDDGRTSRSASDASDDKIHNLDDYKKVLKSNIKASAKSCLNAEDGDDDL
mmetsp:Transcript_4786/g.6596  ORF Transcript_4786/g.6596 Transcript_4786/m.6596 type:complete len:99 (+) Transcript_4786:44-340(+)